MKELHQAIGLSILVEPPPPTYIKNNTHRTTVGAVLNGLHIPSTTLELGPATVVDPAARKSSVAVTTTSLPPLRSSPPAPCHFAMAYTNDRSMFSAYYPSCTPHTGDAGLQGCKNALVLAGCLTAEPILKLDHLIAANVNAGNLHRVLSNYPRAPCAGLVDYVVPAGAPFQKGDLLAVMRGGWPILVTLY